jgi:hypothetical protein
MIHTEETQHLFKPGQSVVFPRRANGTLKVHWESFPTLGEIVVGDVIAPIGGWPTGKPDLVSGRIVTNILPSRKLMGYILSYRPVNGTQGGKMLVPAIGEVRVNTPDCKILVGGEAKSTPRFKAEPKNTSGLYMHLESGEEVRFKIAGAKGRKPHCNLIESPGTSIQDWDVWQLVSGKRHPEDPRG